MNDMRLSVNPAKSCVISYSSRRRPFRLNIKYNNQKIEAKNQVRYLGITFHRTLSWTMHVNNIAGKAIKALNQLAGIVKRNWGIQGYYVASLYKAAIEPILTYGALAWCNAVNKKCLMKPLQRVQRLAARMAACTNNHVHHLDLLNLAGFIPIELRIQELAHSAWIRASKSEDQPLHSMKGRLPRLNKQCHFSAAQQLQLWDMQLGLQEDDIQPELSALKCKIMRQTPEELLDRNDYNPADSNSGTIYFTDGSKSEDGAGAAMVKTCNGEINDSWTTTLHSDSTVFQAELIAIESALIDIQSSTRPIGSVRIYSDSQSALMALSRPNKDKWVEGIRRKLLRLGRDLDIKIGWVKAHVGFKANEMADELAKLATSCRPEMLPLPVSLSQVKQMIKHQVNDYWQLSWLSRSTSWTFRWLPVCNRLYKCPLMENNLINVFNSFITNTSPLRYKLHQWHIITSPDCHYHPGFEETPRHVLFVCDHHEPTRVDMRNSIRKRSGNSDLTFKNIITNPNCVHLLAESIFNHLRASKPLIDNLLIRNFP